MADYENGKIPPSMLRRVSNFRPLYSGVTSNAGSDLLRSDAWAALNMLQAAFAAALGRTLNISEAYRGLTRQTAVWQVYMGGGPLAARVGSSNHGWAVACDFGSGVATYGTVAKVWMDEHAPAYGWWPVGNSFGKREAWHFEFRPGTATASIPAADSMSQFPTSPSSPPVITIPEEDYEMRFAIWQGANSGDTRTLLVDIDSVNPIYGTQINADETSVRRASGTKFVAGVNQSVFDNVHELPDAETVRVMGFDPSQITRIQGAVMDLADDRAPRFSIIFGTTSGQGSPYMLDAADGKRRSMTVAELSVWRASDAKISETTMQQVDFDKIPVRA